MSAPVITPRVFFSMRMTLVDSLWFLTTSDLTLSTMSVMSSTTPGIVVNSCCAPWILICVTALPSRLESSIAAQAVADRHAEAAFERLGDELAVGRRQRLRVAGNQAGQFQPTPSNMHSEVSVSGCRVYTASSDSARACRIDRQISELPTLDYCEQSSMINWVWTGIEMSSAAGSGRRAFRNRPSLGDRKSGTSRCASASCACTDLQALGAVLHADHVADCAPDSWGCRRGGR